MTNVSNPYVKDVDFTFLASQDDQFAKILKSNGQLDFSDPKAVQQLTKSLLKRDFGLHLELPDDRLCPPVPNRLNYILWIQSLLDTTSPSYNEAYDAQREVIGIDIGTGASCIYPLLGCAQRANWRFIGTDIDDKSLQYARQNVTANNLQQRIRLVQTTPDSFFEKLPLEDIQLDFTMCNPPFYASSEEMISSAESKQRPPFSACTGSANEMVTAGGEVAFVSRMIEESIIIKEDCQWFTSMVGKLSSLIPLIEKLNKHDIDNYAVTEFVQGSKTRRWAVAWSFEDLRPTMNVCRGVGVLQKALLPFPPEFSISRTQSTPDDTSAQINQVMLALLLKWMWKSTVSTGLGFSEGAVWSRAARRKAARGDNPDSNSGEFSFGFKICVEPGLEGTELGKTRISIRWMKGHDSVVFESFCGMLAKKIEGLQT